jgi:hypothetical protein
MFTGLAEYFDMHFGRTTFARQSEATGGRLGRAGAPCMETGDTIRACSEVSDCAVV